MSTRLLQRVSGFALLVCLALVLSACGKDETTATITAADLAGRIGNGTAPAIFDVRTPEEYEAGHIPGAINIPHDQLSDRIGEFSPYQDMEVVVYCRSGKRAGIAETALAAAGFRNVKDLEGHMQQWEADGYPTDQVSDSN